MKIMTLLILYVLSVITSLGFSCATKIIASSKLRNDINNLTYGDIGKYDVVSFKKKLKDVFEFLKSILFPGLNVYENYHKYKEVTKAKRLYTRYDKAFLTPDFLINIYKTQKLIEDSLRLEGLTEQEIQKHLILAGQEVGHKYISEEVYEDIKASKEAMNIVKDLEVNDGLNLSSKERIKILKEYRKAILNDSKETMKPIQKTIKLNNKNNI